MNPPVSCILPVFNGARYLREAIDSVLAQGYAPFELIVVDDGSTDDTPAALEAYGSRIARLRQENAGPGAARNLGLMVASGEFIAFQDADDIWVPGKLALQLARFAERPDLDLCFGHMQNFWEVELRGYAEQVADRPVAQPLVGFGPPLLLARRDAFDRVGLFNESLDIREDTDWFLRAREAGLTWEILPQVLLRRRRHGQNLTVSQLATHQALFDVIKMSIDRPRTAASDDPDGTLT